MSTALLERPIDELVGEIKTHEDALRALAAHAAATADPSADLTQLRERIDRIRRALVAQAGAAFSTRRFAKVGPRLFQKEIVREGKWTHPVAQVEVEFSRERLERIVDNTTAYMASVGRIPFPEGHEFGASATLGWVHAVWLDKTPEGKARIVGLVEVNDDMTAGKLGNEIRDVSMMLDQDAKDSHGNEFSDVITHVAATPYPVIDVQANFEALALSKSGAQNDNGGDDVKVDEKTRAALGFAKDVEITDEAFAAKVAVIMEEKADLQKKVEAFAKEQAEKDAQELQDLLDSTAKTVAENKISEAFDQARQEGVKELWAKGLRDQAKEMCRLYSVSSTPKVDDTQPAPEPKEAVEKNDPKDDLLMRSHQDAAQGWSITRASDGLSYERVKRNSKGEIKSETIRVED